MKSSSSSSNTNTIYKLIPWIVIGGFILCLIGLSAAYAYSMINKDKSTTAPAAQDTKPDNKDKQDNKNPPGTGRYIKLYNPKVGCMDFTEIKVYSTDPNINIVNTSKITTSSNLDAKLYPNSNWVDGNIDTFGHTLCTDAPWVEFDFGKDIQITKIILHPRLGWKGRTRGIILTIKDNNNNIIYTAKPITSKTGEVEHSEAGGLDGYNYYTYNIPDTQWVGS
jgi:hypothetical protein